MQVWEQLGGRSQMVDGCLDQPLPQTCAFALQSCSSSTVVSISEINNHNHGSYHSEIMVRVTRGC